MSHRVERIEKIIERELALILREESHNEKLRFVSITKVNLTNDLSVATIWYRILGTDAEVEATKNDLVQAKGFLRSSLATKLDLRKTPDLRFKYDESLEYGNRITSILDDLNSK